MKVFISWSGDKSRAVASALNDWLPTVLQSVEPWFSPEDIAKGAAWFSKVQEGLTDCKAGIICLTAENKDSPWILFESGAIARGVGGGSVATFLIDLAVQDVVGPLAQFNHTLPDRQSVAKLVSDLNDLTPHPLTAGRLATVFDGLWPNLVKGLVEAEKIVTASIPRRTSEEMAAETLDIARQLNVRMASLENSARGNKVYSFLTNTGGWNTADNSTLSHLIGLARRPRTATDVRLDALAKLALGDPPPSNTPPNLSEDLPPAPESSP
jgi:hypothetical protein